MLELSPTNSEAYYNLSSIITFNEDDPIISEMEHLFLIHDLSVKDHYNLHYALGKAYDDIKNYEKAIVNFKKANRLYRKQNPFNISQAHDLFQNVKSSYQLIKECKLGKFDCQSSPTPIFIFGMPRSGTGRANNFVSL